MTFCTLSLSVIALVYTTDGYFQLIAQYKKKKKNVREVCMSASLLDWKLVDKLETTHGALFYVCT